MLARLVWEVLARLVWDHIILVLHQTRYFFSFVTYLTDLGPHIFIIAPRLVWEVVARLVWDLIILV